MKNILSNSVKFTEKNGSITLTAEKTAEYEDQVTLRFCIRDTGIGIDKDYIPKIFDPFSQDDSGSCGLGLVITKRIVDMMNGSISVKSEKGVGTEFTVTVTLRRGDTKEKEHSGEIDLHALYILVVDDNPMNAHLDKSVEADCLLRTLGELIYDAEKSLTGR